MPSRGPTGRPTNKLKKVSNKHDAIADYLIANPEVSLKDVAAVFEVTPTWMSIVVNSDVFRAHMQRKVDGAFEEVIIPLRSKLLGVAHLAVEKLGDAVTKSQDPDYILAAADKTLHRLGYAPSKGPDPAAPTVVNQQNNFYTVDKDMLAEARERMMQRREAITVAPAKALSPPE